ncbi:UNVERIFIED_CONTAM: hypothetical protein NCL1_12960 [Trichonephila clavipes]
MGCSSENNVNFSKLIVEPLYRGFKCLDIIIQLLNLKLYLDLKARNLSQMLALNSTGNVFI